ncbi:MSHA biogenesis protein MshL [Rubrivivax sp. A210]|uniref:pilus (MSHA type) biogenesis protein MshL n=1 Tax=Rubrivivax sp. A210 TaxID=2772301 RepID=UPI00191A9126|nr:pilus (MSHA type) biogenesis protein MshL [Rubrivivax sp. A210]CAD5370293.1 MSHA biogenesis protein MshL [Rubrivivax sp. A210]
MNTAPSVLLLSALALLSGCAPLMAVREFGAARQQLRAELAAQQPAAVAASAASVAPATPAPAPMPPPARPPVPPEPRFDLVVNGANARDVFLSMVAETRYSLLMHPQVGGQVSATLRGVTVREALESIRQVYGFEFQIEGRRITVFPASLQTRLFAVNYLNARRQGSSEVRVSGSGAPQTGNAQGSGATATTKPTPDSSQISTTSLSDYWAEMAESVRALVGKEQGRQVIASPQAGTLIVRAMPDELREVEKFLQASRLSIERQVMLEAKIVEVELSDGYQSGIDWSVLGRFPKNGPFSGSYGAGQFSGVTSNAALGLLPTPGAAAGALIDGLPIPSGIGGAMGLAIASKGFEAVLGFLESQGELQILSSPRVATLNNQKAVLKVGVDEYFVTNVSGGSVAAGGSTTVATTTLPTLTLTPFFSGIALDVTPQIDEAGMITLHLRPSVTSVSEKTKQVDLGAVGNYRLPLASSTVNETDTVVRVADGHIVAIGGLMQIESSRSSAGLPGRGEGAVGRTLLGNNKASGRKKELVVLIRPTLIRSAEDWQRSAEQALATLGEPEQGPRRVVTVKEAPAAAPVPAPVPASGPASVPVSANAAAPLARQ